MNRSCFCDLAFAKVNADVTTANKTSRAKLLESSWGSSPPVLRGQGHPWPRTPFLLGRDKHRHLRGFVRIKYVQDYLYDSTYQLCNNNNLYSPFHSSGFYIYFLVKSSNQSIESPILLGEEPKSKWFQMVQMAIKPGLEDSWPHISAPFASTALILSAYEVLGFPRSHIGDRWGHF